MGVLGSSYRFAIALTRAANPAAELASPAAVGKLFSDTIFSLKVESFGSDGSASSSCWRSVRSSRRQACVRVMEISWSLPLRRRESFVYEKDAEAVVWVRRSSWERVTLRDEFVGRLSLGSRLPQYLCWNGVVSQWLSSSPLLYPEYVYSLALLRQQD